MGSPGLLELEKPPGLSVLHKLGVLSICHVPAPRCYDYCTFTPNRKLGHSGDLMPTRRERRSHEGEKKRIDLESWMALRVSLTPSEYSLCFQSPTIDMYNLWGTTHKMRRARLRLGF